MQPLKIEIGKDGNCYYWLIGSNLQEGQSYLNEDLIRVMNNLASNIGQYLFTNQ